MKYKLIDIKESYKGFFKINRYRLQHDLFAGGETSEFVRELFERGSSVGVLPYDPNLDAVVLVEQFRIGAIHQADQSPWLIEAIAGMVDKDESTEQVVVREAMEEAGCVVEQLMPICSYLVSPGGTSEETHLFCAKTDANGLGGVHGLDEEMEDIKVHVVALSDALAWVESGKIRAAMPIIALQWLALNKDRVREAYRAD